MSRWLFGSAVGASFLRVLAGHYLLSHDNLSNAVEVLYGGHCQDANHRQRQVQQYAREHILRLVVDQQVSQKCDWNTYCQCTRRRFAHCRRLFTLWCEIHSVRVRRSRWQTFVWYPHLYSQITTFTRIDSGEFLREYGLEIAFDKKFNNQIRGVRSPQNDYRAVMSIYNRAEYTMDLVFIKTVAVDGSQENDLEKLGQQLAAGVSIWLAVPNLVYKVELKEDLVTNLQGDNEDEDEDEEEEEYPPSKVTAAQSSSSRTVKWTRRQSSSLAQSKPITSLGLKLEYTGVNPTDNTDEVMVLLESWVLWLDFVCFCVW